jgi:denticleless
VVLILQADKLIDAQRTTLQPHVNGIFDVKWHCSDDLLATASGDLSTTITSLTAEVSIASLRGHSSTVKCVQWDPQHSDILCTGGRDGNILVWDLRVSENRQTAIGNEEQMILSPVIVIPRAHEDNRSKPGRKGKKLARSVTSLTYPEGKPFSIISSGSFDG